MACYISSRQNRFYAAMEENFGAVPAVTSANRLNAVTLKAAQEFERPRRRDKTGTRTYRGVTGRLRRKTSFELTSYLYGREAGSETPRFGPLVEAALGGAPRLLPDGRTITEVSGNQVTFGEAHGLTCGDGFTAGSELRFVSAVPDAQSVIVNAPFTAGQGGGTAAGGAVTYGPAAQLRSASIFDYWPEGAVQRILRGAAVDSMELRINGDFHQFVFAGKAADLLDDRSFESGAGGLSQFPAEPEAGVLEQSPIPGHLGQAWIGTGSEQAVTLSDARIVVKNNLDFRANELGSLEPRCIVAGEREVVVDLELYYQGKPLFDELYQAARSRTAIPLMIQMGEQAGQMCGIYLPSFIPQVPEFADDEARLRWKLQGSVALGTAEDEIYVAFG